jgi:hypothetical protein
MRIRSFRCWQILLPVLTGTMLLVPVMARADAAFETPFLSQPLGLNTTPEIEEDSQQGKKAAIANKNHKNTTDRTLNKSANNISIEKNLYLQPFSNAPQQIGQDAKEIYTNNPQAQSLQFQLISHGLRGPDLRLMTADLRRAANHESSPQEIWRNAEFTREAQEKQEAEETTLWPMRPYLWLIQDNQLGWEDGGESGLLARSSLIAEARAPEILNLLTLGAAFRLNIADNLHRIDAPRAPLPVRSDVEKFADRTIGLERLYATSFHSLSPEWHTALSAGYLEEMVAGVGGEIIYRPFKSRFAIGAELWQTFRRDPQTSLNLGLNGDHVLTGHINAWYDWPEPDITLHLQAGRYLAEDIGLTAALEKDFVNGAKLKGFITVTDGADSGNFGKDTRTTQGISLSLPLGGLPYIPDGSAIRLRAEPFARDTGQAVDKPVSLFELTEPFTLGHMARYWEKIVE